MSDTTPRAALPLLAAAQAQKHVTHNEALLELDALIATVILDRDLSTPPSSPSDGDTYLVKATGTGAWTGQDGKLAYAIDGGWRFYAPFAGLTAYVADEAKLIFHNGSAWVDFVSAVPLENVPLLGVNATADATNRLTVASAAVLFNNIGASIQTKLNKNAGGDTASLLYQTNFSGRAEIGLTGDDNFHFKVSPDGSTFYEALILNRNTGSQLLKHIDVAAATTIGAAHLGHLVRADASGGAFNVTLPASADADDWAVVRKKDTSTNRVTVKDNAGSDVAWLSSQYDEAMFAFWDGVWSPVRWSLAPLTQIFTASGTWTRPPLAKWVGAICLAGGNGGGSGRRGAAASVRAGGNGGAGGSVTCGEFLARSLGASETVTVGASGAGGASVSTNNTNGNSGSLGGASSFGSHLQAINDPGAAGAGGTTVAAAGPANAAFSTMGLPGPGGATAIIALPAAPAQSGGPSGGGAGGSITSGDVAQNGAAGGTGGVAAGSALVGGNGGVVGGALPSAGAAGAWPNGNGGSGGGGGAASITGSAQGGANGGDPGGGGGGGGASLNGNASGAGGNGGRGEVRVTAYF